jgi:hypothetical protein
MVMKSLLNNASISPENPKRSLATCLSCDLFILPSASLIAREAFEAVGGFDERLCGYEDDDLFLRLFRAGYDNVYISEPLSKWRMYQASSSFSPLMAKSRVIYAKKLFEQYPDKAGENFSSSAIAPRFAFNLLVSIYEAARLNKDFTTARSAVNDFVELINFMPAQHDFAFNHLMNHYHRARTSRDRSSMLAIIEDLEILLPHLRPTLQSGLKRRLPFMRNIHKANVAFALDRGLSRFLRPLVALAR